MGRYNPMRGPFRRPLPLARFARKSCAFVVSIEPERAAKRPRRIAEIFARRLQQCLHGEMSKNIYKLVKFAAPIFCNHRLCLISANYYSCWSIQTKSKQILYNYRNEALWPLGIMRQVFVSNGPVEFTSSNPIRTTPKQRRSDKGDGLKIMGDADTFWKRLVGCSLHDDRAQPSTINCQTNHRRSFNSCSRTNAPSMTNISGSLDKGMSGCP